MRIRSIKPEFWSSPSMPADPWARLLYVAMWNWADDNGVGTANPRELLGFAFPNDEDITVADLRRMLVEIRRAFGVEFYTVAGRPYFAIPSWEKHQKFDRRSKGKHPGPDQAETWLYDDDTPADLPKSANSTESREDSTDTRGNPTSPRRDSVAGTGEQGNRGTEKTRAPASPDAAALFEPDTAIEPAAQSKPQSVEQRVTTAAYERVGKAFDFIKVRGIVKWAIHERGADPADVEAALVGVHELGRPHTKSTVGQYLDGYLRRQGPAALTTRPDAPRDVKTGLLVER